MRILTKILLIFTQTTRTFLPHIKPIADLPFDYDAFLPMLFGFAEYFILADISLRRNGFSNLINSLRAKVLDKIEEEFSDIVRQEFEKSAPTIGQTFSQAIELAETRLNDLMANSNPFTFSQGNELNSF